MKITGIEKQKHDEKRYSVFVDEKFVFGLNEIDILYYKLKKGDEILEEKIERIKEDAIFGKARDTAVKYLNFKMRTKKEIENKLREKEYSDDIIERVIELLEKYKYIDDYKYAGSFIRDKFNINGFGKIRIKYELKQKGVSEEIIEKALEKNELNEVDKVVELIEKKYGIYEYEQKEKKKIESFLARRGFEFSAIKEAFDIIRNYD